MEDVLALANPDPEFEQAVKEVGSLPPLRGDVQQVRDMLALRKQKLNAAQSGGTEGVRTEDTNVPARDGHKIPGRIYRPASPPTDGSPLVVIFHGGGFCLGNFEGEELICRLFAQKLNCVCLSVSYRLAPEHPFPAAPNDCWDTVQWAASNASKLGADPSKGFVVGGTSAGGNLTDVCGHLARDEKLSPPLTGLLEMIPAVLPPSVVPEKFKAQYLSYEQNKDAHILPQKTMEWFMDMYKPDDKSPLYVPFNNPNGHTGLPPIFFQVCGMDPLRDEALIYERVLREEAGVTTKLVMYPGLPHGFWSVFPDLKCSRKFVQDTVGGMEWLLSQGK